LLGCWRFVRKPLRDFLPLTCDLLVVTRRVGWDHPRHRKVSEIVKLSRQVKRMRTTSGDFRLVKWSVLFRLRLHTLVSSGSCMIYYLMHCVKTCFHVAVCSGFSRHFRYDSG